MAAHSGAPVDALALSICLVGSDIKLIFLLSCFVLYST